MNDDSWAPGERGRAAALAIVLISAVLYPLRQHFRARAKRTDGFPLSYYPMFSAKRANEVRINYGVAVHADDSRHFLPQSLLGTGGLNQVRRQLNRVVREDRVDAYAEAVAARVAARPDLAEVARIEIVRGEFDIDECFLNRKIEGTEEVLGGADVVRVSDVGPVVPGTDPGVDMVGMPL